MNCRKCGCLILETDERCPMCEARQHIGREKKVKERYISNSDRAGEHNSKKKTIAVFSLLGMVVLLIIFLFNRSNERSGLTIAEMAIFINLIDGYTTGHHSINMTDDFVYIAGYHGDIMVFDHSMNYVETIHIDGDVMIFDDDLNHVSTRRFTDSYLNAHTLYVRDEGVYFMSSHFGFLHYDFNTGETRQIVELRGLQYIPGWDGGWYYYKDPFNEERFWSVEDIHKERNLYEINILEKTRHLIASDVLTLAVIPDYLIIATSQGVYFYHEETSERTYLELDFATFGLNDSISTRRIYVRDDDLFLIDSWSNILYHKTLSSGYVRAVADNIDWFAIIGDFIIYGIRELGHFDTYIMDHDGNNARTLISYEDQRDDDGFLIRSAP